MTTITKTAIITLLSFGSYMFGKNKHTLVMKYVNAWNNISNKSNKLNNYNQWIPFTNNYNHPIIIGTDDYNYWGVCAVIGGGNNHFPIIFNYHCFVLNSVNEQGRGTMKIHEEKSKHKHKIVLFCLFKISAQHSIREAKLTIFENTIHSPLKDCVATLSEEDNHIHIIGGEDDKETIDQLKFELNDFELHKTTSLL
ncbi:hypothetical protein RFI_05035 [Reticulomyxa filosa]|uniref:Uncharacterized protein n=1 Tax=Reticulomyxa filosa TaxID=46433 RepID=X6P3D9_RETFI|nr:hypothetical protein RFI_05035 [Reticulomyxa filosa]|eukprot:ETO32082.1 hypothetical protein RFI_05035 [Reticulomyxa filosa]